jgi:hypothetical protein
VRVVEPADGVGHVVATTGSVVLDPDVPDTGEPDADVAV